MCKGCYSLFTMLSLSPAENAKIFKPLSYSASFYLQGRLLLSISCPHVLNRSHHCTMQTTTCSRKTKPLSKLCTHTHTQDAPAKAPLGFSGEVNDTGFFDGSPANFVNFRDLEVRLACLEMPPPPHFQAPQPPPVAPGPAGGHGAGTGVGAGVGPPGWTGQLSSSHANPFPRPFPPLPRPASCLASCLVPRVLAQVRVVFLKNASDRDTTSPWASPSPTPSPTHAGAGGVPEERLGQRHHLQRGGGRRRRLRSHPQGAAPPS